MNALRRVIEMSPPGTLFRREGLLVALRAEERDYETRRRMVGTPEAVRLLRGTIPARKLRRLAAQWEPRQLRGLDVPVRVARKTNAPGSDWLYDRDDLLRLAAESGRAPRLEVVRGADASVAPAPGRVLAAPDDADAIADAIIRKHYG